MRWVLLLTLALAGTADAARPRWRVHLGSATCKAPGLLNEVAGVADLRLTCRGPGKPFRKGTLRLVRGDGLLDAALLRGGGHECVYVGSFVLGTGCDALFNCHFASADSDCPRPPTITTERRR